MFFTLGFSFFTFGDKNKRAVTQASLFTAHKGPGGVPVHDSSVADPDPLNPDPDPTYQVNPNQHPDLGF